MRVSLASLLVVVVAESSLPARAELPYGARAGTCLGGSCQSGTSVAALPEPERPPYRGPARPMAWVGLLAGAAVFGGSIAIAAVRHSEGERVTRSLVASTTGLVTPAVAFGAYMTRRRSGVAQGVPALRSLGWVSYAGALPNSVLAAYGAFHGYRAPWPLTVGLGFVSALALWPHAFDAYVSARQARLAAFSVALGPVTQLTWNF